MRTIFIFILIVICFLAGLSLNAQTDSAGVLTKPDSTTKVNNGKEILLDTLKPAHDSATLALAKKDSLIEKKHDPHKATIRSAIIPGWGQAYNHEYWKIPIVYGALAVPGSLFIYNNKWYQKTKEAYDILVNGGDTSSIDPKLEGLSPADLQYYRNSFRKSRDYSVLFFLLVWGLNVADATVFAHLKDFDVSSDLSMHIQPDYNITTKTPSLGFVFNYKEPKKKLLPSSF
ncbi:MAG: hypothetical protein JO072_14165 [Parafilimonas sp.]|nr:hypothetical protein [Parafilimonas sp.]